MEVINQWGFCICEPMSRAMLKACHQVKDMAGVAHVKRILNSKRLSQSISSTDFTTIDDPAQD